MIMVSLRALLFRVRGHYSTLQQIFTEPPPSIRAEKLPPMLVECGVKLQPGPGDGTRLRLGSLVTEIHTAQDGNLPPGVVRTTRKFLENAGITPVNIWSVLAS
jgi:hypothetical protein